MKKWLSGCVTDALGRPEPKMLLGILLVIAGAAYGLYAAIKGPKPDWIGFGAMVGAGTTLMGASAIMDDRNDGRPRGGE